MRLIKVTDVQGCFTDSEYKRIVDLNPEAIAWIDPIGSAFGKGPFFCVRFIGNSSITVDAADYMRIVESAEAA